MGALLGTLKKCTVFGSCWLFVVLFLNLLCSRLLPISQYKELRLCRLVISLKFILICYDLVIFEELMEMCW